jgi:zinc-ribbon domain
MLESGYVVICLFFGLAGGIVGRIKGSSFVLWFLISALIPFLGLLTAVCYRWENRELRRQCPNCGRVLKLYDTVCMHCGAELEFPEVALVSEDTMRRRPRTTSADRAAATNGS